MTQPLARERSLQPGPRPGARECVLVAMSGGVDSSLAAALVVEAGYEAIGVSMHLAGDSSRCCSRADADDARRVAEKLGIRFYVANYSERFTREVVEPFADAYLAGRTPIPCVICNTRFKFSHLLERARVLGAGAVATGHYARIERDAGSGLLQLRRARDRGKDQSYFLFELSQEQLACIRFPLGELHKQEVRARARGLGLCTADKPESQEICFVPDADYASVVERLRPESRDRGGEIVDEAGRVLGQHAGIHRFTVGQRHGLGLASPRRLYVTRLDVLRRQVVVADERGLEARGALLSGVSWSAGSAPVGAVRARVQVRHRHTAVAAEVEPLDAGRARVLFDEPVRAVAPGQAAVFYDDPEAERVLGGGWIDAACR